MPTIDRVGPYRIFFCANEGTEPPHVHVQRERGLAKYWLQPVSLVKSTGLGSKDLRQVQDTIEERWQAYLDEWHDFFGNER